MNRVRISTTVDGDQLLRCRRLLDTTDSRLLDQALAALLEQLEIRRELAALEEHPYEEDPDLRWEAPPGPVLPYDGEIPPEVLELAEQRRKG